MEKIIFRYAGRTLNCSCGKVHSSNVKDIYIDDQAIEKDLPAFLASHDIKSATVVCDPNGYSIAAGEVGDILKKCGIDCRMHVFSDTAVVPDETSVGEIAMDMDLNCDIFIAVGSGTINDLTRYVSAVAGKEYCVIGTAPSMDGYISAGSSMIQDHIKKTYQTHAPMAGFFEPRILAAAPRPMIAAGMGDVLGKCNCLVDWKLSNIINDEWFCDNIADIVTLAINMVVDDAPLLVKGGEEAASDLLEALLLTGVCMDYAGNSRPVSGCEHHFSHLWEMRYILEGREPVLHGAKVGIAAIIALKAYRYLASLSPDFGKIRELERMGDKEWEENIRAAYLGAAGSVMDLEREIGKNDQDKLAIRLTRIEERWDDILALAKKAPAPELVENILVSMGAPVRPAQIGIDRDMAWQTVMYAKDVNAKYTILQLLWDLGELENFADIITEEYYGLSRHS